MNTFTNTNIILYHRGCQDGYAASCIARMYNESHDITAEYIGVKQGEDLLKDLAKYTFTDCDILSFDVAFVPKAYELLKKNNKSIHIYDHHKTTMEAFGSSNIENLQDLTINTTICGAVLAWHYYFPLTSVPLFLRYIQDRDLWQTTQEHSEFITESIYNMFPSFQQSDSKKWIDALKSDSWYDEAFKFGSLLVNQKNRNLQAMKPSAMQVTLTTSVTSDSYTIMLLNTSTLISDIGNLLVKENSNVDFALLYRIVGDEIYVSLRSLDKFDTTIVSKLFNGGGHKCASGFTVPFSSFKLQKNKLHIDFNHV